MSFRYDFDMYAVRAKDVQENLADTFAKANPRAKATDYVAMFRDPALVKALRNAGKDVRDFFADSGFKFDVYDSGAPTGRYPADQEAARTYCIERMTDAFRRLPRNPERDWNGFDMVAFTQSIVKATPIEITPRPAREAEVDIVAQEEFQFVQQKRMIQAAKAPQFTRFVAMLMLSLGTAMLVVSVYGAVA